MVAENHNEFTRFAFLYDLVKPKAVYLTVAKKVQWKMTSKNTSGACSTMNPQEAPKTLRD